MSSRVPPFVYPSQYLQGASVTGEWLGSTQRIYAWAAENTCRSLGNVCYATDDSDVFEDSRGLDLAGGKHTVAEVYGYIPPNASAVWFSASFGAFKSGEDATITHTFSILNPSSGAPPELAVVSKLSNMVAISTPVKTRFVDSPNRWWNPPTLSNYANSLDALSISEYPHDRVIGRLATSSLTKDRDTGFRITYRMNNEAIGATYLPYIYSAWLELDNDG